MSPKKRLRFARVLMIICLIGWPATHILMIITRPPESNGVFHLLLALSWFAIIFTAWDIIQTADVRKEQDNE